MRDQCFDPRGDSIHCGMSEERRNSASKQYHTAKRVYDWLVQEMNYTGGESTVRSYVSTLKERLP